MRWCEGRSASNAHYAGKRTTSEFAKGAYPSTPRPAEIIAQQSCCVSGGNSGQRRVCCDANRNTGSASVEQSREMFAHLLIVRRPCEKAAKVLSCAAVHPVP